MSQPPALELTFVSITGGRRLTFGSESLLLEIRDSITGAFLPEEELFWPEVEAVYIFQRADWQTLAILSLPLLPLSGLIFLFGFELSGTGVIALFPTLIALGLIAAGLWVLRFGPRHYVRVVGAGREIRFSTTDRHYVRRALQHAEAPVPFEYLSRAEARARRAENTQAGPQRRGPWRK